MEVLPGVHEHHAVDKLEALDVRVTREQCASLSAARGGRSGELPAKVAMAEMQQVPVGPYLGKVA